MGKGGHAGFKNGSLGTQMCMVAAGLYLLVHIASFAVWPKWTTLTDTGGNSLCRDTGGSEPMKGAWADLSVARYDSAGPTVIEGRSCCSAGLTSATRVENAPADYHICEHPTDPRSNWNACTGAGVDGTEDACCALPAGEGVDPEDTTVTCKTGFSPIMEAYDATDDATKQATGCKDDGGDPDKVQWHCCSCEAAFEVFKVDNPELWEGMGCNPRDGCTFEYRMKSEESHNVMNLLAGLFMCFLGAVVSTRHIKYFAYAYLVFACVWSVGGVLTLSWMLLMSDHCADNLAWAQLSADERHMYTEYNWCENVGGWTFVTLISLFITLFGIVAGVMASCCSMGLYVDESLEDDT